MKLPFRSALPPLDSAARLPLLLAALLAAAFVVQLVAVDDVDLPPAGAIGGGRGAGDRPPEMVSATGGASIVARSMFAPNRAADGAAASPLGGMMVAGSVQIGRAAFVVVQGPGNRTSTIGIGGSVGTWRLRAIRANEALLVRGEERITVPFGAREAIPAAAAATRSQ